MRAMPSSELMRAPSVDVMIVQAGCSARELVRHQLFAPFRGVEVRLVDASTKCISLSGSAIGPTLLRSGFSYGRE